MEYVIEFLNPSTDSWLSATCDYENCGIFATLEDAKGRIEELEDENEDISFRIREA